MIEPNSAFIKSTKLSQVLKIASLFIGSFILFMWGLRSQEIVGFDSRFYLFALEMWRHGVSAFPTTYRKPYPDYPATSTILIYAVAKLLGGINKWVAVLPSAMLAAISVTLTYCIGALHDKRFGINAAFLMIFTVAFLKSARSIALDMYPTMITVGCFYLIHSADKENKSGRSRWVYLLLFIGFVCRGPIGLVIPAGVISIYYFITRHYKRLFLFGSLAFLLLLISTVFLLLLAYHTAGVFFMHQVLDMEVLGRMREDFLPHYFYFTHSMRDYAFSFPLCWLVLLGLFYYTFIKRTCVAHASFLMKLVSVMMIILMGMSIPGDKKIRYILPIVPYASLIAAYPFVAPQEEKYFFYLRFIVLRICLLLPSILLVGLAVLFFYPTQQVSIQNFPIFYLVLFFIGLQLFSLLIVYYPLYATHIRETMTLLIATLSFVVIYLAVIEPIELSINKTHDFVAMVEAKRLAEHARLVFYKETPDSLPIKYLINMKQEEIPRFINNQLALFALPLPSFVVMSASYYNALPSTVAARFRITDQNTIGRVPVVVLTNA